MKTHRFDPVSFLAGLFFTLVGLALLLPQRPFGFIEVLVTSGRWVWPALLLAIGGTILGSAMRERRESAPDREEEAS